MKRYGALTALALVLSVGAAGASDLKDNSVAGAFGAPAVKGVSWTSVYIGGQAGYGNSNHNMSAEFIDTYGASRRNTSASEDGRTCDSGGVYTEGTAAIPATDTTAAVPAVPATCTDTGTAFLNGIDSTGFFGGANVGADLQRGKIVIGVFGNYNFSEASATSGATFNGNEMLSASIEDGDSWMAGARLGYLLGTDDRTLVYVLGGYGEQDVAYSVNYGTEKTKDVTFSGWIVGAGVEHALTQNVAIGIEYQHAFYDAETLHDGVAGAIDNLKITDELDSDKVMATLKVKLNGNVFGR
jgi:opacity protein-like surface antigen